MFKTIDKKVFGNRLGVKYNKIERGFVWCGIAMMLFGMGNMVVCFISHMISNEPMFIVVAGATCLLVAMVKAMERRIKQLI
jgi:hypothetical protein